MVKRKIIEIDEDKCTGCEKCIDICAEAALKIVNGKAKLIKDFYCDGMGACLNVCPYDALKIVEKESEEYDFKKTYEHVKNIRGEVKAKEVHGFEDIKEDIPKMMCGCPSSQIKDFSLISQKSILNQWPIQLKLIMPDAPYFKNSDLLIAADCTAFAYSNFHNKFLKDKKLVMLCPKLDNSIEDYINKLSNLFEINDIKSITIVKMEVPCCMGVSNIVKDVLAKSKKQISVIEYVISTRGDIL